MFGFGVVEGAFPVTDAADGAFGQVAEEAAGTAAGLKRVVCGVGFEHPVFCGVGAAIDEELSPAVAEAQHGGVDLAVIEAGAAAGDFS